MSTSTAPLRLMSIMPGASLPEAAVHIPRWPGDLAQGRSVIAFFRGRRCALWDVVDERLVEGYPAPIERDWPGLEEHLGEGMLRGALHVPAWGERVYFFVEGRAEAIEWDLADRRVAGAVKVSALLPSTVTQGDFTAVHAVLPDGRAVVYAFREREYTRWLVGAAPGMPEDGGFPRFIADDWKDGLLVAPRTALYVDWPSRSTAHSNRKLYFFLGDLYLRWDVPSHTRNYKLDVASGWKGWPSFG